jgi:hypothetical protein
MRRLEACKFLTVEKMFLQVDARVRKASNRVNKPSEPISVFWPLRSPDSFP